MAIERKLLARASHAFRPLVGVAALSVLCIGALCLFVASPRAATREDASPSHRLTEAHAAETALVPKLPHVDGTAPHNVAPSTSPAAPPFRVPASVCETEEFQSEASRLNITVYVFAWRRMASLKRTIESLQRAEYCGRRIPLRVYIDGGAWPEVVEYVRAIEWVHGHKSVVSYHEQGLSLGIRGMWIRAARGGRPDEHVLPLEDDIEVSPLYYWWLMRAARAYGSFDDPAHVRAHRLVGISLYTPRLNEIAYPQTKWLPDKATDSPVFLLQVPCSWGALFLGSVWAEFLRFYEERVRPPFFNFSQEAAQRGTGKDREPLGDPRLFLPHSRSNVWPRSWKRFMIDFMFGRGYVMLYPSLRRQKAFSTTYMERGGHSAKDGKEEAIEIGSLRRDVDPLKTVQLQQLHDFATVCRRFHDLPPYHALPSFDLYHRRTALELLVSRGFAFTENIRWWGALRARTEARADLAAQYATLAATWSGMGDGAVGCAVDHLQVPHSEGGGAEGGVSARYLVYQPPGGIGEWVVALRNAVGIARALRRTLVLPHLMWGGGTSLPLNASELFDVAALQREVAGLVEMAAFLPLQLTPSRIILLRGKEPLLAPSRTYFDAVAGWRAVPSVWMSAQNGLAADYARLYGSCADKVLALSHVYAAFDGANDAHVQEWLDWTVVPTLLRAPPEVEQKADAIAERLRQDGAGFTCVHLADLDTAVLHAPEEHAAAGVDVAEPAASSRRGGSSACAAYDLEAVQPSGRQWVRELMREGAACAIDEEVMRLNLDELPQRETAFVIRDGKLALGEALARCAAAVPDVRFTNVTAAARASGVAVGGHEWPALEQAVCARATTLLLNRYSPLSAVLARRAIFHARHAAINPPLQLGWHRPNSQLCLPIFTKTARFDIVPNRFGILGQFGPDRKLHLSSTNMSRLIGPGGRIVANASVELDVFISNISHHLHKFEYTKENNRHGVTLSIPRPAGGWRTMTWHSLVIPITDAHYSYPMSTPWDRMDRLELYYSQPSPFQPKGDFVRIRNVYLRSSRSYSRSDTVSTRVSEEDVSSLSCRELARRLAAAVPSSTLSASWKISPKTNTADAPAPATEHSSSWRMYDLEGDGGESVPDWRPPAPAPASTSWKRTIRITIAVAATLAVALYLLRKRFGLVSFRWISKMNANRS
ncbi:hypothetical protein AB1Y20_019283 [Prymnesium parvum]|uniref:Protein xylosyltransferase n=1 Tax=Prymnesium parvum TaxID=97485 RepID=A0AB34JQR8_PRYPA